MNGKYCGKGKQGPVSTGEYSGTYVVFFPALYLEHHGVILLSVVYQQLAIMLGFVFRPVGEGSGRFWNLMYRALWLKVH
jgi:hypothetical protein